MIFWITTASAGRPGWQRQEVDWRVTGGGRVKAIRYPEQNEPPLFRGKVKHQPRIVRKKSLLKVPRSKESSLSFLSAPVVMANVIDSPPVDGFVPWITVAVTDERSDDFDWVAESHLSVVGSYLTDSPETNFVIGLFDTGASSHVMGYANANLTGIFASDLLTPNVVELAGATSSVFGFVSQPLAIFMDGLAAIEPNGMTLDNANMVGQSNVSIFVGDEPPLNQPDLPTVIGTPMSVNFVTVIRNDSPITITYDGNNYTTPDIRFFDHYDSRIPDYANNIPLKIIPSGAFNIQYLPDYEAIFELIFRPGSPSTIVGNLAQSPFFIDSVDIHNNEHSATDKDRFMLDTGAQITVIGSGIASRLGLNPANPDFEADIRDVTGQLTIQPGFYIYSLDIPALGDWLSYTNVPVVMLDIASPEGGYLDGIIGMNLFVDFNLVLRGGGLPGQGPPALEFELVSLPLAADIAPDGGDGIVNSLDFAAFADAWLATPSTTNWNSKADMAPETPDGTIDFLDLAVLADYWLDSNVP